MRMLGRDQDGRTAEAVYDEQRDEGPGFEGIPQSVETG